MGKRRPIVLVEGPSDVAALSVLAGRRGLEVELVPMGGITNVGHHLAGADGSVPILGVCDEAEVPVVVRALHRVAAAADPATTGAAGADADADNLGTHGWFVCRRDLEDELIRAVGIDVCLAQLGPLRLERAFDTFGKQPAWAGRDQADQLRRFAGAGSGRKVLLARTFAACVPIPAIPPPLRDLFDALAPLG